MNMEEDVGETPNPQKTKKPRTPSWKSNKSFSYVLVYASGNMAIPTGVIVNQLRR